MQQHEMKKIYSLSHVCIDVEGQTIGMNLTPDDWSLVMKHLNDIEFLYRLEDIMCGAISAAAEWAESD